MSGYDAFCSSSEKPPVMLFDSAGPAGIVHADADAAARARREARGCFCCILDVWHPT